MKSRAQCTFRFPVLAVLVLVACNGRHEVPGDTVAPARDATIVEITLERTACLGGCPIYRLEMDGTGLVRYEGIAFVEHIGVDSAHVAPEHVRDVIGSAEELGYFALADSYRQGDATCSGYFPDSPSVIIDIIADARQKRVVVDHGCMGFPQQLPQLAELIDRVAGSARWIGH